MSYPLLIRVVVMEDFPILLEGMVSWLNQQPDVCVVGQAGDHASARQQLLEHAPTVLLMDLMVGGRDGLDFIREIRLAHPKIALLVFSMHDELVYAERVLRAGAQGYVMKREPTADLLSALSAVAKGELAVSRQVTLLLLKRSVQPARAPAEEGIGDLTDRELHVLSDDRYGAEPTSYRRRSQIERQDDRDPPGEHQKQARVTQLGRSHSCRLALARPAGAIKKAVSMPRPPK